MLRGCEGSESGSELDIFTAQITPFGALTTIYPVVHVFFRAASLGDQSAWSAADGVISCGSIAESAILPVNLNSNLTGNASSAAAVFRFRAR